MSFDVEKERRLARLDMNEAHYLTYRGSMDAILRACDEIDIQRVEISILKRALEKIAGQPPLDHRSCIRCARAALAGERAGDAEGEKDEG